MTLAPSRALVCFVANQFTRCTEPTSLCNQAEPFFRRSEGSPEHLLGVCSSGPFVPYVISEHRGVSGGARRIGYSQAARQIPRPAGESAGLRDDALTEWCRTLRPGLLLKCVIPKLGALQPSEGSGEERIAFVRISAFACHKRTIARQARFYDFNVWTERKRIEKLRYIHRNPVKRGLVAAPEQWRWSSFRWYLCGEVGPVRINDTDILVMRVRPPAA
jgi:hypothetical protein